MACCRPTFTIAIALVLEQTRDFIRWAGCYEAKLEREASYRQLVYEHLRELLTQSGLGVWVSLRRAHERAA